MNRPSKKRTADEAAAAQQEQSEARLELDVITGSLWQPTCQALNPIPSKIPLVFQDEAHYRRTFEPVLMEEARGSLRSEFDEAVGSSRGWAVTVTRCAPANDGVFHLTLRSGEWGHGVALREGAIVVLIRPAGDAQAGAGSGPAGPGPGSLASMARAAANAGRWNQSSGSGGGGQQPADTSTPLLGAMVRMRCRDAGQALEVSVRPCCGNEAHKEDGSPCNRALHMMIGSEVTTEADRGEGVGTGGSGEGGEGGGGPLWLWLVPLNNLITNVRELKVLQRLGDIKLMPELVRPASYGTAGAAELPQVWPQDARHEPYYKYLYSQYDVPQREAIVAAAAHLATPDDLAEAEAQGIATGAAGAEGGPGGAAAAPGVGGQTRPLVPPITLVQGPPGTGKTHTVRGILNTWHSIMYHRHHSAWLRRARELLTRTSSAGGRGGANMLDMYCSGGGIGGGGAGSILDALSFAPLDAPKPRILVCAPSNAATDELLDRILTEGFCDFGGAIYRPNVVRVGAEEAPLSAAVKAVWTEAMMNRYAAMGPESWAMAYKDCESRIANCNVYMAAMAAKLAAKGRGGAGAAGAGGEAAAAAAGEADNGQDLERMAADLVRLNDHLNRAREEMSRLDRAGDLATSGSSHLPGYVVRRVREDLELSLMEEAEMVFTTLSSTGRAVFSRLGRGFDFVLIDEAAQASEIAALQPLLYGCRRLVMVGDPQQLPATLFSAAAKETLLERSLFERLAQAGSAVKMLSVQYRMHPEIRTFPSSYFYHNRLLDGESVIRDAAQPPPFYAADLLKPYVVYDVCGGREWLQGRSRSNEAEADMALGLYLELMAAVRGGPGIGAAAAEAAASLLTNGGGGRGVREPTPFNSRGGQDGTRGNSVERSFGGAPGPGQGAAGDPPSSGAAAAAAQAFGFLAGYTQGVTVGIITPYRAQRELIRRKFAEALGPAVLDAVRIETVDSFQGKQLDVIILSCVRTARPGAGGGGGGGGGGGVGFLADVRRMNVAITRAKQSLWVLGQFAALRREPSWAALISNAEERGCVIEDASAGELCLEWAAFQERYRTLSAQAAQAAARAHQEQATAAAAATAQQQQQMRLGLEGGGMSAGQGGPPPPGMGLGMGMGQLPYQQPPPPPRPKAAPEWAPQPQHLQPQHLQPQPGGPVPAPMRAQPQPQLHPQTQPLQMQVQPPGIEDAPPGFGAPFQPNQDALQPQLQPQPRARGRGRGGASHHGRTGPHVHGRHRAQLQPQPLPGQQLAAGLQSSGRGRGGLASMLPKHGRGPGEGAGEERGARNSNNSSSNRAGRKEDRNRSRVQKPA